MVSKLQNFMVEKDVEKDVEGFFCEIARCRLGNLQDSLTWDPRVPIVTAVSADFSSNPARPRFEALLAQW